MNNKIIIDNITKTTYEDGSCWIQYCNEIVGGDLSVTNKVGFVITDKVTVNTDKEILENLINSDETLLKRCLEKPYYKDVCSEFLANLIIECLQSENEMWYVDYDDMEELEVTQEMLEDLKRETGRLGIREYVSIDDGEYAVCVYGGVITKFLF